MSTYQDIKCQDNMGQSHYQVKKGKMQCQYKKGKTQLGQFE